MIKKVTREPSQVDILVGKKIKQARTEAGLTQAKVAQLIGLTFQQLQKYESGSNRVSAGLLYTLSHILEKPINFFFVLEEGDPINDSSLNESCQEKEVETMTHNFSQIKKYSVRMSLDKIVRELKKSS